MTGLLKKTILFLLVIYYQLAASAQTRVDYKIDPVFRYIIESVKSKNLNGVPAFVKNVKPTPGYAFRSAIPEERYECIVYTKNARSLADSGMLVNSSFPTFATVWATLDQIVRMAEMRQVEFVEAPKLLNKVNDLVLGSSGASLLHQRKLNNTVYKGKNVLVAIFDSGIDWKHLDFRNPDDTTKSRILRIWDQTITAGSGEAPPAGFSYGVEYSQTQINNEIDGSPVNFVRERDTDGHGTHVAGTAVGNGSALSSKKYTGVAPESDIIVIKGGDSSFLDSRMIDAITYLQTLSTTLGKPVVLNLSLGTLLGAHDGTRPVEVAINSFTNSAPGRVVAAAAGNDGGSNKHNQLNLAANASSTVSFTVPAGSSGSEVFSYRIYSNTNGSLNASLTPPGGGAAVTAAAGQSTNSSILSGNFNISLDNNIDPGNNNRYVDVSLGRNGSNTASPAGTYTLTLTNNTATAIRLDGWLYKVNASFAGTVLVNGDNNYLVSSPGNASSAITVASYVARNAWYTAFGTSRAYPREREDSISSFSSRGPRRDNVLKPEISANGQGVISTLSSSLAKVDSAFLIEKGLYNLNQGTSMATPAVSGSLALLLQANTAATSEQLKTLLTSTATKGGMTELPGATPNSTWGFGKLDVFKAASALFNCGPADRRTYKYDSSTRNSEQTGFRLTTERLGVRFTPDMSGKLGGIYYETAGSATSLIVEVRASTSGNPGTLLGTLKVPSNLFQKYSWNYFDISTLNVSVASGVDYFIVVYRDPSSSEEWTIGAERVSVDNRSVNSSNNGANWSILSSDLKIRSVVYNNGQVSGAIATTNSIDTKNINSSNQFINSNCQLILQAIPNGINPVTGTVTGRVWIESTVQRTTAGPFVQRHYQIAQATATSANASITLYFTQAEFTAFNSDAASTLDLPANPSDAAGKANLRIARYSGTSSDNSGSPSSYSGSVTIIDPADGDIVWNAEFNRWEVTFDATGFGGYFVQTNTTASSNLSIEYFRGNNQGSVNTLTWKVNCTNTTTNFDIERSSDGVVFAPIGTVTTAQDRCLQPFTFNDPSPLGGKNYYRLKAYDGRNTIYSDIVIIDNNNSQPVTRLYPTVLNNSSTVNVVFTGSEGTLSVYDAIGRQIVSKSLVNGSQSINLKLASTGIYFYTIRNSDSVILTGKILIQ